MTNRDLPSIAVRHLFCPVRGPLEEEGGGGGGGGGVEGGGAVWWGRGVCWSISVSLEKVELGLLVAADRGKWNGRMSACPYPAVVLV